MSVVLSAEPGAPTPDEVVDFDYRGGQAPPLRTMAGFLPNRVEHFLPYRAGGDFGNWIAENPNTPRARMERRIIIFIPPLLADGLVAALARDEYVERVTLMPPPIPLVRQTSVAVPAVSGDAGSGRSAGSKSIGTQQHHVTHNIGNTWSNLGVDGWSLVHVVDSGIDTGHPDLRSTTSLSPPTFTGGNFLPDESLDWVYLDLDVDERQPVAVPAGQDQCCPGGAGCSTYQPVNVGHGTHVARLIGATSTGAADPVKGVCKHCGLGVQKIARTDCLPLDTGGFGIVTGLDPLAVDRALAVSADQGAQVVNFSFRLAYSDWNRCQFNQPPSDTCDALAALQTSDVALAAASGNDNFHITLPASGPMSTAVGGLNENLGFWNDFTTLGSCWIVGLPPFLEECASNWTAFSGYPPQELMAQARNVLSTVYRAANWSTAGRCGDSVFPVSHLPNAPNLDGIANDGYGHCTGTSMSAPQVAGIFGLLRSINPLVHVGDPFQPGSTPGLRSVLRDASNVAPWDPFLGFGIPDAEKAARRMLGKVRSTDVAVANRATPLFTQYSAGMSDVASTPSPQYAMAMSKFTASYQPASGLGIPASETVRGYPQFAGDYSLFNPPRANLYVLVTNKRASESHPPLIPLYGLDRLATSPVGCNHGLEKGCIAIDRDFMIVASEADLNAALADGYRYIGRQGYIYAPCKGDACRPPGTVAVMRLCKPETVPGYAAWRDCAIFPDSHYAAYFFAGYVSAYPAGSSGVLGYAYPAIHSDLDDLVDGMEYLIGTHPGDDDSDNDGLSDSDEFPVARVPLGLPCDPSPNSCP